jgi:L-lactate dehydrogenase complex protein LldE
MDVEIFIPCFVDQIFAQTAQNFVKILEKVGCNVHYNRNQTCCGQPTFNSGYWNETRDIASKFLNDFDNERIIVSPGASCSGFIRNFYPELFEGTASEAKAKLIGGRLFELCDFLVNKLKIDDLGASFPHKVTFHDSCSALREYGIKTEPRRLLEKVKGLQIIEMEESETCCGFGGTFSVKHSAISSAMAQQKVEFALETGAEYIVSTEASCLLNIHSYIEKNNLPIKTIHIADIISNF